MSNRHLSLARTVVLIATVWVGACSGDGITDPPPPPVDGPIVSDPLASLQVSMGAPSELDVAFVSLPPGTVPSGAVAVIRNQHSTATITTTVADGGFDPVPLAAVPGDSVKITVAVAGGPSVLLSLVVPGRRHPVVVRADPPPRKRDVPLNSSIVVVFSEPIDFATLSASSVTLFHGSTAVAGAVRLLGGSTTAAVFDPDEPLAANADYELVVTKAVRDLSGDPLAAEMRVPFGTGTTIEGAVASVIVFPDSGEVLVGSQYQLSAIALDADGNAIIGQPISWTSFDTAAARISPTGLVSARGPGVGSFQAEVEGRFGYATLYVSETLAPVASVTVTPESGSVFVGRTFMVTAEARDAAGNLLGLRPITWTSRDPATATVAPSALRGTAVVTGRAPGAVAIGATVEAQSDTSFVQVLAAPPIVGFAISPDTLSMILGGTAHLTGVVTAADGWTGPVDGAGIAWSSSDPAIASVSAAGIVTTGQVGSTTITARWNSFTATAQVHVAGLAFVDVRASYGRACGLTLGGAVYCWGTNWGNAGLGNGTMNNSPSPVPVAGNLTFTAISVGGYHTCGLTSNGLAYCWGYNGHGEIGDGTNTDRLTPVLVSGGLHFSAVTAGATHTCGITVDALAYCWGQNWNGAQGGELGDGTTISRSVPVAVVGGLTFATLTAGADQTCGLTSSGAAYCWGWNRAGASTTPVAVSGGLVFVRLSAGGESTCGVTADSLAYCWGANGYGQLGNGTFDDALAPTPVAGGHRFGALSTGGMFPSHACGLIGGGAAYCWGRNTAGEVGDGTVDQRITPVAVVGGLTFARVNAGESVSCGVTLTGDAYCWGDNYYGELGNGSFVNSRVPVKVLGQP